MEKYGLQPVQSKLKQPKVHSRRDTGGRGILDTAAHIGNQGMLALLGSEEERPGSSLDRQMWAKFERQFGIPMDDVRVHRNSRKPAGFDAGALAYGSDVYLGPGQEELLPHELVHTVQQKMGMVPPQGMENGLPVNNSPVLEQGADAGTVHGLRVGSTPAPVVQKCPPKARVAKYRIGTHGYKRHEQRRLTDKYGSPVSGATHQSEHAIGFSVLNNTDQPRRNMREFENELPAYQEVTPAHRSHMGTGLHVREDAAFDSEGAWTSGQRYGFETDQEYRDAQYAAMTDDASGHGVGNAVQLNQLGYSVPYQQGQIGTPVQIDQANDSFFQMASGMAGGTVQFYERGTGNKTSRPVSQEEVAEIILARLTMPGQSYPSVEVENEVRGISGLPPLPSGEPEPPQSSAYASDQKRMMDQLKKMQGK